MGSVRAIGKKSSASAVKNWTVVTQDILHILVEIATLAIEETSEAEVRKKTAMRANGIPAEDILEVIERSNQAYERFQMKTIIYEQEVLDRCIEILALAYRKDPGKRHLQAFNVQQLERDLGI